MTAADLARSASTDDAPPEDLTPALRALWLAKAGRWDEAHDLCQHIPGTAGAWIHAWLHRDLGGYFLQVSLKCVRRDQDGWATSSPEIGDLLRATRNRLGLTRKQLAERLQVAEGTLGDWENKAHHPRQPHRSRVIAFLGGDAPVGASA